MNDLTDEWRAANPDADTPDKAAAKIFGSSKNGTFIINDKDQITDTHAGFGDISPFKESSLTDANDIGYSITQTYSVGAVNGVGGFSVTYTIPRKARKDGGFLTYTIMKTGD